MTAPLPPEKLDLLLPALRHVAELVQKKAAPDREGLRLLLLAGGLDEHWAVDELERWCRVLTEVRGSEDADKREIAVRALMLRGVPEAPAKLAVDMVANTLPPPTPEKTLPIQVSPTAVGFGELQPGEGAQATLKVSGGAGWVTVGSDMVAVEPKLFGPEETTLTITVKGGVAGQVLWSSLILESNTEKVEVPITARWHAPSVEPSEETGAVELEASQPLNVQPEPSKRTWVVSPSGGGDYRTLEEAIRNVPAGATLHLASGTHRLYTPLVLTDDIVLEGEGMDVTRIVCDREECVVRFSGKGRFQAQDLSFVHEGSRWANVVVVDDGQISLLRCRFTGGVGIGKINEGETVCGCAERFAAW